MKLAMHQLSSAVCVNIVMSVAEQQANTYDPLLSLHDNDRLLVVSCTWGRRNLLPAIACFVVAVAR